jgi:predicted kinase
MIVVVMGLPGSGKSFFASRLATAIHADYINSDRLRKKMIKRRTYSIKENEFVYDEMLKEMRNGIKQDKSFVLDATFYKSETRNKFKEETRDAGRTVFIEIIADEALIKKRLQSPREDSEADFTVYKFIQQQWEPIEEQHLILQSTNDNIEDMLKKAVKYLYSKKNDKRTN